MASEEEFLKTLTPEARAGYKRMMYGGKARAQPAKPEPPATAPQQQTDIPKVKRNIKRLLEQNAPEEDIDAYVASEGVTFEQLKAHKSQPQGQDGLAWSDVPGQAFDHLGSSAARTAYNIVYPFLHPIDTATAFKNIGVGAYSKAKGGLGFDQDPNEKAADEAHIDAVGQFFVDRYGSIENLKKTLAEDPVGVMADASVVLSGGGAAAARVPGVIGKAGQAASRAGSVLDPIANAGRAVKLAGKGATEGLGLMTGTGGLPLEYAFKAGRKGSTTFADNMRDKAPIGDVLETAQTASKDMKRAASDRYTQDMLDVRASTRSVDLRPIAKSVEDAARMVYVEGGQGARFTKSAEAADTVKRIADKLDEYNKLDPATRNMPQSVDALKQAIGEIRQSTQPGTLSRNISDKVYNSAKDQIVKQVPEYAKAMKGYSQSADAIDDAVKTLSLGENAAKDTGIRKLTSAMRNNVNTNYGRRVQLVDELAKYQPELPYAIAGQSLNSITPRGLSRLPAGLTAAAGVGTFNPMVLPALAASSPRLMGEALYGVGKATGAVEKLAKALMVDTKTAADLLRKSYATNQMTQPALVGSQTGDYPAP